MTEQKMTLAEALDLKAAKDANGMWVPASGGTEQPFTSRSGRVLLYCWQISTGRHAYLDVATDTILSDEDAFAYLQLGG